MQTRQKKFYLFFLFFRGRNSYVSQIFTSQNQIFHRKNSYFSYTFLFFPGKEIFMYHKFSHLRTKYFIGKNTYSSYTYFSYEYFSCTYFSYTYFSYTCVLLEHNRVLLQHGPVLSEHSEVLSEHSRVLSAHNRVLSEHNEVFSEHNGGWDRQKIEENGRILHNLAFV